MRAKSCCNSCTAFHQVFAVFAVCGDSCDAVYDQCIHCFSQSRNGFKKITKYNRLKSIQLQLSGFCRHGNGGIMSYDVESNLAYYLRNDRIYLTWHDGRPILLCWKIDLPKSGFRAGRHQSKIVAHLGKIHRTGFYYTGYGNKAVQIFCCVKKVLGLFQRITCKLFQIWHDLIKIRIGNVDSSSHCSSSKVYGIHFPVSLFDTFPVSGNHGRITVEHLTKTDRNCILKLCTSHSDHIIELLCLFCKLLLKSYQCFFQRCKKIQNGKLTGRRNHIIGGLRHVYVIIWMDHFIATLRTSEDLTGSVCDHLIHIHICAGSGTTLNGIYDKFLSQFSCDHFITGSDNGICLILRKKPCIIISDSCCFFNLCQVPDKYRMKLCTCNRKILFCP